MIPEINLLLKFALEDAPVWAVGEGKRALMILRGQERKVGRRGRRGDWSRSELSCLDYVLYEV